MSIYCIKSTFTDKIYIGSTKQDIRQRWREQKSRFKNNILKCSSRELMKYQDCFYEVLETNITENLKQREKEYIEKYNCVNKELPTRTKKVTTSIWNAIKIECPNCGSLISQGHKLRHMKTKRCINFEK
jgi:predicted RNA-binding Zn-ribbon protein involved in translation (DUF1610 family)